MIQSRKMELLAKAYRPELFKTKLEKRSSSGIFFEDHCGCIHEWNPYESFSDLMPLVIQEEININIEYIEKGPFDENPVWECNYDIDDENSMYTQSDDLTEKSYREMLCEALLIKSGISKEDL